MEELSRMSRSRCHSRSCRHSGHRSRSCSPRESAPGGGSNNSPSEPISESITGIFAPFELTLIYSLRVYI